MMICGGSLQGLGETYVTELIEKGVWIDSVERHRRVFQRGYIWRKGRSRGGSMMDEKQAGIAVNARMEALPSVLLGLVELQRQRGGHRVGRKEVIQLSELAG